MQLTFDFKRRDFRWHITSPQVPGISVECDDPMEGLKRFADKTKDAALQISCGQANGLSFEPLFKNITA